ncbi:hypothetical protein [Kluyvera georgiana]|uniref:hypothetical protein n=1 Tax=Kluyvera georgiana TaxID=73098 RepID=UPI000C20BE45|nr:hypothetical protein [Kluyvera georgiana]MDA8495132.1 hypothetical protein [Kluyvera georgiana]
MKVIADHKRDYISLVGKSGSIVVNFNPLRQTGDSAPGAAATGVVSCATSSLICLQTDHDITAMDKQTKRNVLPHNKS